MRAIVRLLNTVEHDSQSVCTAQHFRTRIERPVTGTEPYAHGVADTGLLSIHFLAMVGFKSICGLGLERKLESICANRRFCTMTESMESRRAKRVELTIGWE